MQAAFGNPKDKNPLDLVGSVGWYEFHLGAAQLTVDGDQIVALGTRRAVYSAQQDPTPTVALKTTEIFYHICTNLLPACKLVLSCLVL
jgi:hypothetical protein